MSRFVIPGEPIADESNGFMSGWGTYSIEGKIYSAVAGIVHQVDKLINVNIKNMPYRPEQGDVIIGRVVSIEDNSWRININSNRDATLNLVNINLPEGEQRRRGEEDILQMKKYFSENDLVSGEVLTVHNDGGVSIQTRNLKYGKLKDGVYIKVNSNLIRKMRLHFIDLINNVKCILGKNGGVWIYYSTVKINAEYFSDDENLKGSLNRKEDIPKEASLLILIIRNIVLLLNEYEILIEKESIFKFLLMLFKKNNIFTNREKDGKDQSLIENMSQTKNEEINIKVDIERLYDCSKMINDYENFIDLIDEVKDGVNKKRNEKNGNFNLMNVDADI